MSDNINLKVAIIPGLKFLICDNSETFKIYPAYDEYFQIIYDSAIKEPIIIDGFLRCVTYHGSGKDDRGSFIVLKKEKIG